MTVSYTHLDVYKRQVLGCTHYPLVADSIRRLYPGLPLIDPAEEMARALKEYLEGERLLASGDRLGGLTIYTTGDVKEYALRALSLIHI